MSFYIRKQHKKLKLSVGDITINNKKSKFQPFNPIHQKGSDPFISYKQTYQLPPFKAILQPNTINLKRRLRSLESRPNKFKIKSNLRSKSILTDNIQSRIIRVYHHLSQKQLCTVDVGDINQSTIKNQLDHRYLTEYQKIEIKKYKEIYYVGHKAHLRKYKEVFRDNDQNYKPIIGDHIAYRFQIVKIIGSGAFGKVLQVFDHKNSKKYALKILKSNDELHQQFKLQIKILKIAKDHTSTNKNIVQIKGDFQFRGHLCIVTQMLSVNVYSYIKSQNYTGFQVDIVRKILIQLMQSLLFLHHRNIIHCDIKPQNVVFKQLGKSGVKLIDFGSACFYDQKQFTYIQSRYYRSPEIVLMKPYDKKIDIWSLGCLIYQIYTGMPLFPSKSQEQQMQMLLTTLGIPPQHFLSKCQRANQYDFSNFQGATIFPLKQRLKDAPSSMISLVQWMVRWSPQQRPTIQQCLLHQFILQGLPKYVCDEHIKQMNSKNPYNLF